MDIIRFSVYSTMYFKVNESNLQFSNLLHEKHRLELMQRAQHIKLKFSLPNNARYLLPLLS